MLSKMKPYLVSFFKFADFLVFFVLFGRFFRKRAGIENYLPEKERILVCAPHVDDEILGAGGTLFQHSKNGADIRIVYFTDGSASFNPILKGRELSEKRKKEAFEIKEILHCSKSYFLDWPDGKLTAGAEQIIRLLEIISDFNPGIIYLPFFLDTHPDHVAVNKILAQASIFIKEARGVKIFAYGIESPLSPVIANKLVDISAVLEDKENMLAIFKSQTMSFQGVLDFNRYHSFLLNGTTAVELFLVMSLPAYVALVNKYVNENHKYLARSVKNPLHYIPAYFHNMRIHKKLAAKDAK